MKNGKENKSVIIVFIVLMLFILWYWHGYNQRNAEPVITTGAPSDDETDYIYALEGININTADREELDSLMYIGDREAEIIIKYREENGSFESIEDIMNVNGIGLAAQKVIIDNCYVG